MKKILGIIILIMMIHIPAYASGTPVTVEIPDYDVTVNGEVIDTEHSQYPVLKYRNITYFPMTSDYLSGLGLNLKFSSVTGFKLNKQSSVGVFNQKFLGASNKEGSKHRANLVSFNVEVNGKKINNSDETYPVLVYKNITYFPMTWRFAVEEFGWQTKWSNETGFAITVPTQVSRKPVLPVKTTEAVKNIAGDLMINGNKISYTAFTVDLENEDIEVKTALANDTIGTTDTLGNIAKEHQAVLAINGSYFSAYDDTLPKDPYGILVVDGTVVHNSNDRATIAFSGGKVDIDRVDTSIKGTNTYKGQNYPWYGWWMNHTTYENGTNVTIFDGSRGSETLSAFGTNYVIQNDLVIDIVENQSVSIPENGYVVNINGLVGATPEQVYDRFGLGYRVDFDVMLKPSNTNNQAIWDAVDYATGAGPALILDGKKDVDFEGEGFTEAKINELSAARSAIGYTSDNELIFVTTSSTIDELAELMLSLGCYEAMNLDGGASSGLWYNNQYERTPGREISNIIYVTTK